MYKSLICRAKDLLFVGIILVCSTASLLAQQAALSCKGPLTEEQVTELLKAGVADGRVQAFVKECGVNFELAPETEGRLRRAGASDALIKLAQARSAEERKKIQEAERLRQAAIEEEKRGKEVERLRQATIEEEKNREAVRIAELRRKLGFDTAMAHTLKPDLALDEARKQLVSLRAKTHDIEVQLKAQYPDLDVGPNLTKDAFETTAEFQAKVDKANAEHAKMLERYRTDLASLTADDNKQIDELLSRKYARPGLKAVLVPYDADRQLLVATTGNYSYRFTVEPTRAHVWYDHQGNLAIKGNFLKAEDEKLPTAKEISLADPQGQEELTSVGVVANISGTWKVTLDSIFLQQWWKTGDTEQTTYANPKEISWKFVSFSTPPTKGQEFLTFDLYIEGDKLYGTVQSSFQAKKKVISQYRVAVSGTSGLDELSFKITTPGSVIWQYEGHYLGNQIHFSRTKIVDYVIPDHAVRYQDQITVTRER
jgi:hypothetical protein